MTGIGHWLNSTLYVWRQSKAADGSGGFTITWANQGPVACKIDQSTPTERLVALQAGASHTHNIYLATDTDVRRNDRLAPAGVAPATDKGYYHVTGTAVPSSPRYLKAVCERVEAT